MLDPWIIAEIRRREEDRLREAEAAIEHRPGDGPRPARHPDDAGKEPRGVTIVDYTVSG